MLALTSWCGPYDLHSHCRQHANIFLQICCILQSEGEVIGQGHRRTAGCLRITGIFVGNVSSLVYTLSQWKDTRLLQFQALYSEDPILQLLRDPGSRLHVQLTAYQGIGLPASEAQSQNPTGTSASVCQSPEPVELLSGFVSYEQIADAMGNSSRSANVFTRQEEAILSLRGPGLPLLAIHRKGSFMKLSRIWSACFICEKGHASVQGINFQDCLSMPFEVKKIVHQTLPPTVNSNILKGQ